MRTRAALFSFVIVIGTCRCGSSGDGAAPGAGAASDGGASVSPGPGDDDTSKPDGGAAGLDGASPADAQGAGDTGADATPPSSGPWTGLRVDGVGFVDGAGKAFLPRGLGIGEWRNIESYMISVDLASDSPGMGESGLRAALTKVMGPADTDQFFTTWEANIVTADDVASWKSWGVNTVRVPINHHAISTGPGVYVDAGFAGIDQLVAWCKANGIYVILDLHAAPGAQNCEEMGDSPDGVAHLWKDPTSYRQWTIDLWQTIAKRYANETAVGGYDIFDEPYDTEASGDFSSGAPTLRSMYVDVTQAIRAVDPNHILFFEGTNWSSIDSSAGGKNGFAGLAPAWDPQMAWAFHKYWDDNTTAAIQGYLDLRTSTQRPVWNGETGEDQKTGWSGAMIALLEANGIGWNVWTYKKVANNADFYSITPPANWSAMQAYFKGGAAPSAPDAKSAMMELAANAATAKCTLQSAWLKEVFGK
jgi:hypothetical protein